MKKHFFCIALLFIFCSSFANAEEAVYLAIQDVEPTLETKIKEELSVLPTQEEIEEEKSDTINEDVILEQEVQKEKYENLQAEIDYDIINYTTPLFSEYKTFYFDKGIVETLQPYFAYQGDLNFLFTQSKYHTTFTEPTMDIAFTGKFREVPVEYKFLFNVMPRDGYNFFQTFIQDDFITFKNIPNHRLTIGSFRTPIGVEGGTSGYTLPFLTRAQISRNFGSVRGVGVKVLGDYDLVQYNLGVTSSDRNFKNFLPGAEFNGWVNLKPLGKTKGKYGELKIGGGLNAGHREFDYSVVGAYLSYKYKKMAIKSEYAIANGSNGLVGLSENKADGFYTTLSYNITKKLQVLARYDYFNANKNASNCTSSEYTAGLNYYVKGSALKFMLNYVFRQSDYAENSNRIMLGTQIIL